MNAKFCMLKVFTYEFVVKLVGCYALLACKLPSAKPQRSYARSNASPYFSVVLPAYMALH